VLLVLLLLAVVVRLPALAHLQPIDDEAVYSVVASEMVDGGLAYRDAIERKPPLLFWTYEAVFTLSGASNWLALHSVATLWVYATMLGLVALGAAVSSTTAGIAAAVLYGVFQPWATWRNLAFNGEVLMNLPIVWAWAIALGPTRTRRRVELLLSGALSAAAVLLKQPAAIAAAPLLLYLWLPQYRRSRGVSRPDVVAHTLWFAAGGVAVVIATGTILWRSGTLADALYWTIGDHDVPHVFWGRAVMFSLAFVGACLPLVAGTLVSLLRPQIWNGRRAEQIAVGALFVASAVGTAASGRFYPHYYIQLLPPMAVMSGVAYAALRADMTLKPVWLPSVRGWIALTVLAAAGFNAAQWWGLAHRAPASIAGAYVREHSPVTDRIFVWGQSPQVYLEAQRRPASRYIATFPLTGYVFAGPLPGVDTRSRILPGAWDTLQRDFAAHPPAFIVDREVGPDALYPLDTFPVLAGLVAREFMPVLRMPTEIVYARRAATGDHAGVTSSP
jgi:4-amino-4-deoxy-L-arabinose transferase-like glycosyltransferase